VVCENEPVVAPYLPAPGQIRVVLDHVPAGLTLPPSLQHAASDADFVVVDVTPVAQHLFALGRCPHGELVALGQQSSGPVHAICLRGDLDASDAARDRYALYDGQIGPGGGDIAWTPAIELSHVRNGEPATRVKVISLDTASPGAPALTYELQRTGVKQYETMATERIVLEPGQAPTPLERHVPLPHDDAADRETNETLPTALKLRVESGMATVRSGRQVLARWELPPGYPMRSFATCDGSGCVATCELGSSAGFTSLAILRSRRGS
jgi:hypothetical protein